MDMDVPLPEELEWLEANSHFPEEEDEQEILYPDELDEEEVPLPKPSISAQKRPRSNEAVDSEEHCLDEDSALEQQLDEKRAKVDSMGLTTDDDLEWLRYSPPRQDNEEMEVVVEDETTLSRYASQIDGDCIPVTGSNGDRVYAKIGRVDAVERLKKLDVKTNSKTGLISEPINFLLQKVEQEAFVKALKASSEGHIDKVLPETQVSSKQLWVDKYSPSSFTDLLSDEHINREVLLWLKKWDSGVFGSEIRSTSDEVLSSLRRHSSTVQRPKLFAKSLLRNNGRSSFGKESFAYSNNIKHENSSSVIQDLWNKKSKLIGPPEQKILLLCGAPGLGKTTLAHVAVKHCGYRVVEINASDDRSASTIESKILNVVEMNSVISDSKPQCLVIDEIDGALGDGKGAVEVILKLVSAEKKLDSGKENNATEGQSGKSSSRKGRKTISLLRPVICICNDLYAPALRKLRQVAKVHIFVQPTVTRIVSRLKYICSKEGMRVSSIALTALAEYTGCDIRSCLNTLQFLHKKNEALNALQISSQVVGRKDMSRSVFDIWKELFQNRKLKSERKIDNGCCTSSNEFDFLHSLISSHGDYDLIMDGVHENLLQLRYHDPLMRKTVCCLNGLGVSDLVHQYIMRTQQMPLYVYQPHIAITIHRLVAQVEKPLIEWPRSFHRYRTTLTEKVEIFKSWHYKISPDISRHLSIKSFTEDSVSLLLDVLSPATLRPVALQLLSEKEKNDLAQLVSTMVSYSITYKNIKSDPLPSSLRHETEVEAIALSFDPPLTDFINFKDYKSDHYVLASAVKQLLIHEVEKKRILQLSINRFDSQEKQNQTLRSNENNESESSKSDHAYPQKTIKDALSKVGQRQLDAAPRNTPSTLLSSKSATLGANSRSSGDVKKSSRRSSNFFERFIRLNSEGSADADGAKRKVATAERDSRPVLFKFNEGFTNAVKRPVRMREFLL